MNIHPKNSKIQFYCHNDFLLFSVLGMGNMNNAHVMFGCIELFFEKGVVDVCIDFAECSSVDSTFMGTLLLIHEECYRRKGALHLINITNDVKIKLEEIGIGNILLINQRAVIPSFKFQSLPENTDQKAKVSLILKAHERLTSENPENHKKFGFFVKELKSSMHSTN